jgi:hypothetical protein
MFISSFPLSMNRWGIPQDPLTPFNLKVGDRIFTVKRKDLSRMGRLFDSIFLQGSSEYEVLTRIPPRVFEVFMAITQKSEVTVRAEDYELLWLLAEEFEDGELSDRFETFLRDRDRHWQPPPSTYLGDGERYPFAYRNGCGPVVTIRVKDRSKRYELLKCHREVRDFGIRLGKAKEKDIVIDGIEGRDRLIEKAVEAVYSNAVANICNCDAKKPFLVLTLWQLHLLLSECSIDASIYCLNRLHKIVPSGFDKARLLLLSQCIPSTFIPLPRSDWHIIYNAIFMLQEEANGETREANELLERLKDIPQHLPILDVTSRSQGRADGYR